MKFVYLLHLAVVLSNPMMLPNGKEVILRCVGYPAYAGERLEWAFKEFGVSTTYVFDDSARGAFSVADKEASVIAW